MATQLRSPASRSPGRSGSICSLSLIVLAIIGLRSSYLARSIKLCLLWGTFAGLACALCVDLLFGYFFAIRQVMFVLVPLVLLAAVGISVVIEQNQRLVGVLLIGPLLIGSVVKDIRYFSDHGEDWAAGARAIKAAADAEGCVQFVAGDEAHYYAFFEPSLLHSSCQGSPHQRSVIVPSTRSTRTEALQKLQGELGQQGYRADASSQAGGTTLTRFHLRR